MKNVLELIRVSTEKQAGDDRAGIPAQREANRRTSKAYGLDIVKTIEIVDVSGAAVLSSPEMQELLRLMESPDDSRRRDEGIQSPDAPGEVHRLRFATSSFIEIKLCFISWKDRSTLASKSGRLLGTVRAAMAGMERQRNRRAECRTQKNPCAGPESIPVANREFTFWSGYSKSEGLVLHGGCRESAAAFALFLGGETSYIRIGRRLNISRTNVRFIFEKPDLYRLAGL